VVNIWEYSFHPFCIIQSGIFIKKNINTSKNRIFYVCSKDKVIFIILLKMATVSSSSSSSSSSSTVPQSAAPSPTTATHALSTDMFWQSGQFWPLCRFLFTIYNSSPVWTRMRPESFRQLCSHTVKKIDYVDGTEETPPELLKNVYFLIVKVVRGSKSNQRFHGDESPEFLKSLHSIYKYLYTINSMPLFGHLP
jgi:hypothetical protein